MAHFLLSLVIGEQEHNTPVWLSNHLNIMPQCDDTLEDTAGRKFKSSLRDLHLKKVAVDMIYVSWNCLTSAAPCAITEHRRVGATLRVVDAPFTRLVYAVRYPTVGVDFRDTQISQPCALLKSCQSSEGALVSSPSAASLDDQWVGTYQNMMFMNVPHCTALASKISQLEGWILGMATNPIIMKGNIMNKVMNTATLPTIDSPLQHMYFVSSVDQMAAQQHLFCSSVLSSAPCLSFLSRANQ